MADFQLVDILPDELIVGDSFEKTVTLPDFPASPGWVLDVHLLNGTDKITLPSTASGDNHVIARTAAQTVAWNAGEYDWQAHVDDTTDRFTVARGHITITEDFEAEATLDARSDVKKIFDALEATIVGKASKDQLAYTIASGTGSRSIQRMTLDELIKARDRYKSLWEDELKKLQETEGQGPSSCTRVEFTSVQ